MQSFLQYQFDIKMNFLKSKWQFLFSSDNQQGNKKQLDQKIKLSKVENKDEVADIPQDILEQFFSLSSKFITQSKKQLSDQEKLKLYALYKQAKVGDCNTPKPALYDLVNKSKWNAWNQLKGTMSSIQAKKNYIIYVRDLDKQVAKMIQKQFNQGEEDQQQIGQEQMFKNQRHGHQSGTLKTMVQQVDYSENYSHPFFKRIDKGQDIEDTEITIQLLLTKNGQPECYPLHFAIDKERVNLVTKFIAKMTPQQIESIVDSQGMGVQQYAKLIENEEIIQIINAKLNK